jgi:hypothetical protein
VPKGPLETKDNKRLHDLVLSDVVRWLGAFHHLARGTASIQILDKSNAQGTTSVLVTSELG